MKFWLHNHNSEPEQMLDIARIAEEVGFYGIVDGDHWATPVDVKSTYPYSVDGKVPGGTEWSFPDNFVSAAAIAVATKKLVYGSSVLILANRNNPLQVAKAAGTAAILGGDRVVMGVAGGWMKDEYDMAGIDWDTRTARMEEAIEVCRKCWAPGPFEHHGKFFDYPPIFVEPVPKKPVPIWIGGHAPAALRRAGRIGDGFMGPLVGIDEVAALVAALNEGRKEASDERKKQPFEILLGLKSAKKESADSLNSAASVDNYKRMRDLGVTCTSIGPLPWAVGKPRSTIDEKRRFLENFAEKLIRPLS